MSESKEFFEKWFEDNIEHYHLFEWKIKDLAGEAFQAGCHYIMDVVESRKTSELAERPANVTQQLKAEIAALESRLRMVGCVSPEDTELLCSIREEMRQLSAV